MGASMKKEDRDRAKSPGREVHPLPVRPKKTQGCFCRRKKPPTEQCMSQRIDDVMKLCCELSANQQLQATVKLVTGAATAGGLAIVGGMIGGPVGIAVGGAVGGLVSSWLTSGQFKPLSEILVELSPQQQQKLYDDVMVVLGDIQWKDVIQLSALVIGNATLMQNLISALLGYVAKELGLVVSRRE